MTSPQPTSSIEPSETTELKPTFSRSSSRGPRCSSAPLWLTKPTVPGRGDAGRERRVEPVGGFMTPRQLGPTTRIPFARAVARTWRSSSAPAGPDLLEAGRDDDDALDAGRGALLDHGRDRSSPG